MHIKLLLTLICLDISAACPVFTPENTEIHFDLDDTLIKRSFPKICWGILKESNFRIDNLYPFTRNIIRNQACFIGHPWNLVSKGMQYPHVRKYIESILTTVAQAHSVLPGTELVLNRLKEKEYSIVYATNKDLTAYEKVAESLGKPFSTFPTRVILNQPKKDSTIAQEWKTYIEDPKNPNDAFKELVKKMYNYQDTELIKYSTEQKPSEQYIQTQRKFAGNKQIIFFDDKSENIETAGNDSNIYGFQSFKSPITIAHALLELGVFSMDNQQDRAMLEELKRISNPTNIVGTIQNWWKRLSKKITPPKVTPAVIEFRKNNCSAEITVKNVAPAVS